MFAENDEIIRNFLEKARSLKIEDTNVKSRLDISVEIITLISRNLSDFDSNCQFSIKRVGKDFIELLENFRDGVDTNFRINWIFVSSYRFFREYDFNRNLPGSNLFKVDELKSKILKQIDSVDEEMRSQLIYVFYELPADMIREWLSNPDIVAFKKFEQSAANATKLHEDWDKEFSIKETRIAELKNKLDEYQTGFNFVRLHQGFSNLATKKICESKKLIFLLFTIGVLILLPICIELGVVLSKILSDEVLDLNHLILLIPLISLEIILIYFFRVVLLNYRSVKAQILQIELRQTLCEFIQSYVDYASAIKEKDKDKEVLNKFENLIFSGLLSDPEKLPSTFDGLEHIATLIKNIKGTS